MSKYLHAATSLCVLFCSGLVLAQSPTEPTALARTPQDPSLQWGPCPEFLPEGCAIAVLHGDPSKENADIFFKLPAKSTAPRHWHTSAERMVLLSGELHVTYDGHEASVLKPGTYAYGPAKLPHEAICESDEPCILAIAFELPVDAFPGKSTTD